jgi:hypothetical protein
VKKFLAPHKWDMYPAINRSFSSDKLPEGIKEVRFVEKEVILALSVATETVRNDAVYFLEKRALIRGCDYAV